MPETQLPQQSIPLTIAAPGEALIKGCSPPRPDCPSNLGTAANTWRKATVSTQEWDLINSDFSALAERELVEEWIVKLIQLNLQPHLGAAVVKVTVGAPTAIAINTALLAKAAAGGSGDCGTGACSS